MPRQRLNQTSSKISEQYSILVRERLADSLDEPEQIQMIGDMEDRVIHDIIDYLILPQGRYPESFVLISLWEVCFHNFVYHL